jgi:hypothetical protein
MCPGDILALSLAIDLAATLVTRRLHSVQLLAYIPTGKIDKASSVAIQLVPRSLPSEWQREVALRLLRDSFRKVCRKLIWKDALALQAGRLHKYSDAEGRVAEGISALNGYDGVKRFESAGRTLF